MHALDRIAVVALGIALVSLALYAVLPRGEPDGYDIFVRVEKFPFAISPETMSFGVAGDARIIEISRWEPQILVPGRNLTLKGHVRPGLDGTIGGYPIAVGSTLPVVLDEATYAATVVEVRVHE